MAYGVVYLIVDGTNDLEYVGQTTKTAEERFKEHMRNKKSLIGKSIRAHGVENFTVVILKECERPEELDRWEKYFIKWRNTMYPNGYNFTEGGEGTVGYSFTDEQRANVAAARKGKTLSAEHKVKIGASVRGENNGFFGKRHTDEARAKMAIAHRIETPYKNLVAELDERGFLYTALAGILGLSLSSVSEKMHGKKNFTAKDIAKLEKFFDKPIEYLLQRDDGLAVTLSKRNVSPFKNLLREMEKRQLTYTALAKLLGISISSLSIKMNNKQNFTKRNKIKLVEIFNKPIEYLLQRDD